MPIADGDAQTVPVAELLSAIESRQLVLPKFQRKIKWNWEKQKSLLVSISLDMPIGMFMIWNRSHSPSLDEIREIEGFPSGMSPAARQGLGISSICFKIKESLRFQVWPGQLAGHASNN